MDAAGGDLRQNFIKFPETHERFAANERYVKWLVLVDDLNHALNKLLIFEITEFSQKDPAVEMIISIGVTARTAQRAFLRDFDRQKWCTARQNRCPSAEDLGNVHNKDLSMERRRSA